MVLTMTHATLELIHREYQVALKTSNNPLEIVENLYSLLEVEEVSQKDSNSFDTFLDGLKGCIQSRKKTFEITNIATYLNITMLYVILWLNTTENLRIDINWNARRKALESDLTKILRKANSDSSVSANIRDRFGLRGILLNNFPEETAIQYIYKIFEAISGIVASKNRKLRKCFMAWIENNSQINPLDKVIVQFILDTPFAIDFLKDFIVNPKPNGYQSLQFTLIIPLYSALLPGCQFEIQLRTQRMHEVAEKGSASHNEYKEKNLPKEDPYILEVFKVEDFNQLNIVGFKSYNSPEDDKDGIHFPKEVFNRRISMTLVSQ